MTQPAESPAAFSDRSGAVAVVLVSLVASLLLLALQEKLLGEGAVLRSTGYTLSLGVPALLCLLLRSARDRYTWICGAVLALLLWPLAFHTGDSCLDLPTTSPEWTRDCSDIFTPYAMALGAALFVLLPFLQCFREQGRRLPYDTLYHRAWDNAQAMAAAGIFTGAGWLILWLWAALFKLIGIRFFHELFGEERFYYPVTGLLVGLGIVLARNQAGALRSMLRVCLALGRLLLPLIALVALMFLAALFFTGLQPLWDTRRATSLLLCLVLGTVALVNSVYQEGSGGESYGALGRRLVEAALLTLPVYAVIAAIALQLRVAQHGWTVERLWAAILIGFALLYAGGYALAVLWRGRAWLSRVAPVNTAVALTLIAVLLLTQSPLLDLRGISLQSQLARAEGDPGRLDMKYLRWKLGRAGEDALRQLQQEPRVQADAALTSRIEGVLKMTHPWADEAPPPAALLAEKLAVRPQGIAAPPGLLALLASSGERDVPSVSECIAGTRCLLLAVDLNRDGNMEWLLLREPRSGGELPFFGERDGRWQSLGVLQRRGALPRESDSKALTDAAERGDFRAEAPEWQDFMLQGQRYGDTRW